MLPTKQQNIIHMMDTIIKRIDILSDTSEEIQKKGHLQVHLFWDY
jgi:hypothetical protein